MGWSESSLIIEMSTIYRLSLHPISEYSLEFQFLQIFFSFSAGCGGREPRPEHWIPSWDPCDT